MRGSSEENAHHSVGLTTWWKLVLSGLRMEEIRGVPNKHGRCMAKSPERRGGVTLKGAELVTFEITYPRGRQSWHDVFRKVFNTVMSGDDVVVHCMAGHHRNGTTAVMCRALLANESFDDAERHILQRREIEVSQAMRSDKKMAKWVRDVGTRTRLPRLHPIRLGYLAIESSNLRRECPSANMHRLEIALVDFGTCKGQRTSAKQSDGGDASEWPAFKW